MGILWSSGIRTLDHNYFKNQFLPFIRRVVFDSNFIAKSANMEGVLSAIEYSSTSKRVRAHKSRQKTLRLEPYSKS